MNVTPDTKDWTWVLERPCNECGFDTRTLTHDHIAPLIRETARSWVDVLARPDVRQRPNDHVWSPLEYACHVRDVFRLYDERLKLMLTKENPLYSNWDQDATAVADRYDEQEPVTVAAELQEAADRVAGSFDTVSGDQWQRTGARSDGATFTVETFARYFVHDPVHHLHDVGVRAPGLPS